MRGTLILLIKNGATYLEEILKALSRQQCAVEFQTLAIDSGSQDDSLAILARYSVRVITILPAEFNHGETRNLGARLAGAESDFVVYLTQDATPANEYWLDALLQPMLVDESVAGVFSRHIPRPHSSPALARQLTTVWQSGGTMRLVKRMPSAPEDYARNKGFYTYFSDTSSALRRSVWERIPFRPMDFAEDADWADRALQAGYTVVFEPASAVVHSHDYPLREQFRQNVDHTAGMQRLGHPDTPAGWGTWLRVFGGIPREIWRDWQFTWRSPYFMQQRVARKLRWMAHSPLWHLASTSGVWAGAHLAWFPARWRVCFSRQERLRTEQPNHHR